MPEGESKGPGRKSRSDIEDLKARLGLSVKRRAPAVEPAPPPKVEPEPEPEPPPQADSAQPAPQPVVAPPPRPEPRRYTPPLYVEEPPPAPKTMWERWGKLAVYGLVVALGGMAVGYVFGKGANRGARLSQVKKEAGEVLGLVKEAFSRVEDVGAVIDRRFGAARKAGKALPNITALIYRRVDWKGIEALGKVERPAKIDKIFEADYKRFTKHTAKLLVGFFVDFSRLMDSVQNHVDETKKVRLQLQKETKAGSTPRVYGVITRPLPGLDAGEVVILRGRRLVKPPKGKKAILVYDVALRADPTKPAAVPGFAVVPINASGLLKGSGALLAEYNRRRLEIGKVARRVLSLRGALTAALERISKMKI